MNINRLRGDRVIVEFEEKENKPYEKTSSGLILQNKEEKFALRKGVITKVGHLVNERDLKEGMVVYVKDFQGERLTQKSLLYLFNERDIIANE